MSDDDFGGFAPPPFKPEAALQQIQRAARDLKLAERGNGFELRGRRVLEWQTDGEAIQVRIARKLALTPEWDRLRVASTGEQRKLMDEMKKRLARWDRGED
jgi:hypothetical protein